MKYAIELGVNVKVGEDEERTPIYEFKSAGFYNLRKFNVAGHPDGPKIVQDIHEAWKFENKEAAQWVINGDSQLASSRIVEIPHK